MLSVSTSVRPNSTKLVGRFPPGPCCDVAFKEYNRLSDFAQQSRGSPGTASVKSAGDLDFSIAKQQPSDPSTAAPHTVSPSPQIQTPTSYIMNESRTATVPTEIDWSGKGMHVEFDANEQVPLVQLDVIGLGASSLVTKVRSTC
jgi:hypothetical protein